MLRKCIGLLKTLSFLSLSHCLQRPYHVLVSVIGAGNNTLKDINPVFKSLEADRLAHTVVTYCEKPCESGKHGARVVPRSCFQGCWVRIYFFTVQSVHTEWIPGEKKKKLSWTRGMVVLSQTENLSFCLCFRRSYFNEELGDATPGLRVPAMCVRTESACHLFRTAGGW